MALCICDGPAHAYDPAWCRAGRSASYPYGPIVPELDARRFPHEIPNWSKPVAPELNFSPTQLDERYVITHQVDIPAIVSDMVQRIFDAEEGVREQVMVEWLRQHGWRVEKVEGES